MRKHLLFILLLCLPLAIHGQSDNDLNLSELFTSTKAHSLRYWFDSDVGQTTAVDALTGGCTLDVSSLSEGLHTLHYQIVGKDGKGYSLASEVFLKMVKSMAELTAGQAVPAKRVRYWFDNNYDNSQSVNTLTGVYTLDVSSLNEGLHTLHYQTEGTDGIRYGIASEVFLKLNNSLIEPATGDVVTAKRLKYWFDSDNSMQSVKALTGVYSLDVSTLSEGIHTLHYQVEGADGMGYDIASDVFLKLDNSFVEPVAGDVIAAKKLNYWFDSDNGSMQSVDAFSGIYTLDVSTLSEGLHLLHYQIEGIDGGKYDIASEVFLKTVKSIVDPSFSPSVAAQKLRYWFDNDTESMQVVDAHSGTSTVDVSALSEGLHTLHYQVEGANERSYDIVSQVFLKTVNSIYEPQANKDNRITRYMYWLNDNDNAQSVDISTPATPYQLITLLPIKKVPLRSSSFHFEVNNGTPTIYAKNDFHVRFYDARDYFVDAEKEFIDYSSKQEITDMEWLESGTQTTTEKPVANTIQWYYLEAEPGDSVQFRLDHAATLQLFSPSGNELLSTSGYEAVNWFGCHVRENGTYYVALHDVTAQQGTTISIDYNHIDKYAVLRQDVAVVGNGGCSTITYEGNGFRNLYAVDLFTAKGDTIHSVYIDHKSDAVVSVTFDFSEIEIEDIQDLTGNSDFQSQDNALKIENSYSSRVLCNALFHFTEEDRLLNDNISVEKAKDIELVTTVTYPSSFLRGNGLTTYHAKISNEGNMTSYRTPVYIFIKSLQKDGVSRIRISGLDLPALYEGIETDSLDMEDKELISATNERFGDTHYFVKSAVYNEVLGDTVYMWAAYFFTDITKAKDILVEISTQNAVEAWFTIPKANNPLSGKNFTESANARGLRYKISRDEYCCMRSKIECFASIVADGVGIANSIASLTPGCPHQMVLGVADCVVGAINQVVSATGQVMCDDPNYEENFWDRVQNILNGISIVNTLTGCASKILPAGKFKDFVKAINELSGNDFLTAFSVGVDVGNCINAFTEEIPNCPPEKNTGGGSSEPVNSMDPNDIYGYTAESGSHAVKDGLKDVYYRIEFENDTAFATAAAHDIYVTDTLDVTKFDLSTFAPTRVKIGNKSAELKGDKNFVTTIDMRPEINAIAQVEGTLDEQKGIARWHISSLDPMTMEPTNDVMQGVLPVNYNGNGMGELSYDISLKPNLAHGTEINNRAGIVFDQNDVIMTPIWTNTIDRIAPESRMTGATILNDSTISVKMEVSDDGSGPWRYDVYAQYGANAPWWKVAENIPVDSAAVLKVYDNIDYGFYIVATDEAGNVEQKEPAREYSFMRGHSLKGDVNNDGAVNIADVAAVLNIMAGNSTGNGDVNGDGAVNIADVAAVLNIMAGN